VNLALFGAPGSGKGTQAVFLSEHFEIPQVATGDLFRREAAENTELGRKAKRFMDRGELVPDEITLELFRKRLSEPDSRRGVLLDGFPRTVAQAEALDRILSDLGRRLDHVIFMRVPEDVLVARLAGRLICPVCGATYHRQMNVPKRDMLCDRDGTRLVARDDDKPETARRRIAVYHEQSLAVLDHYRRLGVVAEVDGDGPIQEVRRRILDVVDVTVQ
jgi:adenylate kinase